MALTESQQHTIDGVAAKLGEVQDEVFDAMVTIALRDPDRSGEVPEQLRSLDRRYQEWVLASLALVRECDRLTRLPDPEEEGDRGGAEITDRGAEISNEILSDFVTAAAAHAESLRSGPRIY